MAVTQVLFIYCQGTNVSNATTKNTLKQTKLQMKSQLVYEQTLGSRDYSCWDQSFFDPRKKNSAVAGTRRLVEDRSQKSGFIQEFKLATGV